MNEEKQESESSAPGPVPSFDRLLAITLMASATKRHGAEGEPDLVDMRAYYEAQTHALLDIAAAIRELAASAPDYRAALDQSTRDHHATGMPGEQAKASTLRAENGLEAIA